MGGRKSSLHVILIITFKLAHHQQRSHSQNPHHHSHTLHHNVLLSELSCNSHLLFYRIWAWLLCTVPVALGVLPFLHIQPGPHLLPFLTQLHHHVLHAVTLEHEQPRNSRPSCCITAFLFSTDSQSHSIIPTVMGDVSHDFWQPDSTCLRPNRFAASGATGIKWGGQLSLKLNFTPYTLSDHLNKPLVLFKRSYTILWLWHVQCTRCV